MVESDRQICTFEVGQMLRNVLKDYLLQFVCTINIMLQFRIRE